MTPSTCGASTRTSLTPNMGGASITMWANRSVSVARTSANRGEARSSTGFMGTGPAGITWSPGILRSSAARWPG